MTKISLDYKDLDKILSEILLKQNKEEKKKKTKNDRDKNKKTSK